MRNGWLNRGRRHDCAFRRHPRSQRDAQTATELADRVFVEAITWLDEDSLDYQRQWLTEAADRRRLTWTGMKHLASEAGIKVHGHFDGEPGLPDAAAARRAIHYVLRTLPEVNAILLIRDQDDQPNRRGGPGAGPKTKPQANGDRRWLCHCGTRVLGVVWV